MIMIKFPDEPQWWGQVTGKSPPENILNSIQSLPKFHSIFFIMASLPPQNFKSVGVEL